MIKFMLVLAAIVLAGCAAEPAQQGGADAQTTFDGLVRVDNSRFTNTWLDPDADWSRYNKFLIGETFFEFRAVKKNASTAGSTVNSTNDEFWIDDETKAKLQEEVASAFYEELQKSQRFTLTYMPGNDTLIIRGGLHDIVSRVPPAMQGRNEVYLGSVGEATLVLEALDSRSGEVLARAVDRRAAGRQAQMHLVANTATTWTEVRQLAHTWAQKLREGLDSLPRE
jgi:hypothetical protein